MDSTKTPLAVAIFMEIVYVLCLLLVAILPDFSQTLFQSWMHGIDLSTVWNPAVFLSVGSIVLGIVSVFVVTFVLTWLFVWLYKAMVK